MRALVQVDREGEEAHLSVHRHEQACTHWHVHVALAHTLRSHTPAYAHTDVSMSTHVHACCPEDTRDTDTHTPANTRRHTRIHLKARLGPEGLRPRRAVMPRGLLSA